MDPILKLNNGTPTYGSQELDIAHGLIQNTIYNPNGVMTPGNLTTTQPFPVVNPNPTQIPPVNTLEVPVLTATSQEQRQSEISRQLGDLYNQNIGKSAYQTEQDTKFGVDTARANINDLGAQLTRIKNEAAAIPLQFQQGAFGKAIEGGVLDNQINQALRVNAIAALGVSTLLAASQGQLANAQALSDRAVAAKYDPIQERITAAKQNLQLLIDSPETSLQDKNRANAQLAIQNQKTAQVAQDKQNATDIWKVATDAASNLSDFKSTADYKTVTQALDAISKAPTKEEALRIAVATGMVKQTIVAPKILGSASTGYFSYDPNTGVSTPLKGSPTSTTNTSKVTFNTAATNLQKQAIPTKALNKDGTMTAGSKKSLIDKGVPATQVDWLWNAVTSGESFENIRQAIIKGNGNPKVLDTFVQTLQS